MTDRLQSLEETPLDVFESIKRAFIKRGYVRRNFGQTDQQQADEPKGPILKANEIGIMVPDEDPEVLVNLIQNSHDTLLESSTVFPLTFIPDTIAVDREKLTLATRSFFRTAKVNSIPITDIQSVEMDLGPFFGTVKITSKYFVNNTCEIRYLWRDDAIKVHHLVQGLILSHQKQVDINTLDNEQLLILLTDLGQGVAH